ncbi:MAG TPA: DUF4129 domain-containing protein [Caldilineae bacterium]|nr:DUF4129 domain-containing protein [Caldilineae bacterium]
MNWRRWNWVSDAMLPAAMAVQRTCWLWLWLELIRRWLAPAYHRALLPAWAILGLSLGGVALARWALSSARPLTRARVEVTTAGLGVILLITWWQFYHGRYSLWDVRWMGLLGTELTHWRAMTSALYITLFTAVYLWLRGLLDGRAPPIHDNVWGAFTTGFMALVLLVVVALTDRRGLPRGTETLTLIFFAVSMTALALSSLEMGRGMGMRRIGTRLQLSRHWLISMFSVILGLLAFGLILSTVLGPEDVVRAINWIAGIIDAIARAVYVVIAFISYLLYLILYPLLMALMPLVEWLAALLGMLIPFRELEQPELEDPLKNLPQRTVSLPEPARWAILALVMVAIGLAFAMALQRLYVETEDDVEEEREIILSRELIWLQWGRLWRRWLRWLRRARRSVLSPFLSLDGEMHTRRSIRAIYQALLAAARDRGRPRQRGQTPIEYQRSLEAALPNPHDALSAITDGYVQARYGLEPPTLEQVEKALQAWARIQSAWGVTNTEDAEDKRGK